MGVEEEEEEEGACTLKLLFQLLILFFIASFSEEGAAGCCHAIVFPSSLPPTRHFQLTQPLLLDTTCVFSPPSIDWNNPAFFWLFGNITHIYPCF